MFKPYFAPPGWGGGEGSPPSALEDPPPLGNSLKGSFGFLRVAGVTLALVPPFPPPSETGEAQFEELGVVILRLREGPAEVRDGMPRLFGESTRRIDFFGATRVRCAPL